MPRFTMKEKLAHYTAVAKGKKSTKKGAKMSAKEQKSYARGQMDARNEQRRVYAWKNATSDQRAAYKEKARKQRAKFRSEKK